MHAIGRATNLSRIFCPAVKAGTRFGRKITVTAMAQKQARLVVLGSKDFEGFTELDALPESVDIVGLGSADEILEKGDAKLAEVDVLLNTGFGVRTDQQADIKKLWPKLTGLKWMHAASAGVTHILTDELKNSEVVLTNAKGTFSHSLAEYALTSCLYFAKCIPELQANQKAATWKPLYVEELRGKTLGVVGYGDIGQTTAKLARVFGMKILALRRRTELSSKEQAEHLEVFPPEQLEQLMAKSDYVVAALPATPATNKLVSAAAIAALQPHAVFVNLGRGATVDEEALVAALRDKKIKGAALDVFAEEPLPSSSPLWGLENVLVSPHCADRTKTFLQEALQQFVGNVKLYVEGKDVQNVCDKQAGY